MSAPWMQKNECVFFFFSDCFAFLSMWADLPSLWVASLRTSDSTLSRARGGPRAPGHKHAIIISVTRNSHWRWRTHFALRGGSFRPFCRVSLRAGGVRCLYRVNNAAGIEKSLVEDKKVTEVWTRSSMPGRCRFSGCQKLLFYRVYVFVLFFFSPIVCEGNMYIVQKEMWKCNDK